MSGMPKTIPKREPQDTWVFFHPMFPMFSFGAFFCHPSAPLALGSWSARKLKKNSVQRSRARAPREVAQETAKEHLWLQKGVAWDWSPIEVGSGVETVLLKWMEWDFWGNVWWNVSGFGLKQSDGWWMCYRDCKCWWTVSYQWMMNCGPCGMTFLFIEFASKNHLDPGTNGICTNQNDESETNKLLILRLSLWDWKLLHGTNTARIIFVFFEYD